MEQISSQKIEELVIVGGGPVGNFCALISASLSIKTTVYEKRPSYSRDVNVKINKNFFSDVSKSMKQLCGHSHHTQFFDEIESTLKNHGNKIQIKKLESLLREKSESLGVFYIQKQILSFEEAQKLHQQNNPLILDCSGRRSQLRTNYFGEDEQNIEVKKLTQAIYINFDAEINSSNSIQPLCAVIKSNQNLKVGQIVISKPKEKNNSKQLSSHVTIPLFIQDKLAAIFDDNFPNTNYHPLKPFHHKLSNPIPEQIQLLLSSVFCSLLMRGLTIQWDSVAIKKIPITCGYGTKRSHGRYICLGDSAAFFAFYRSLNFGLETAFDFLKVLATYPNLKHSLQKDNGTRKLVKNWPIFNPYTYLIKLAVPLAKNKSQRINGEWNSYLNEFEQIRKKKIDRQIRSNTLKCSLVTIGSYLIKAEKLSPIKISQTYSYIINGYYLCTQDFQYFTKLLKVLNSALKKGQLSFKQQLRQEIEILESMYIDSEWKTQNVWNFISMLKQKGTSEKKLKWRDFKVKVQSFNREILNNTNKAALLFLRCLNMVLGTTRIQEQYIKKYEQRDSSNQTCQEEIQ